VKKSIVIVESPAKARTIEKYLGKNFRVRASAGHVRDLPPRALGVDIRHGFNPTYRVIPGKEAVVANLKKEAKSAEAIYLAADPDREGEAICFHLAHELSGEDGQPIYRILFNEITKSAILKALEHPSQIDQDKVDAQQARRILDRIVGYKVSPLLWQKVKTGLSAGRVQTVAVRLIVEREREIRDFKPEEYWDFRAQLEGSAPPPFEAKAFHLHGKKFKVENQEEADAVLEQLQKSTFIVESVVRKERKRRPVPPFITSKLQQEAVRKLGFTVKKTMTLAQRLYEGVDLGEEGTVGLITYMRTDSTRVSDDALKDVRAYIAEGFGDQYLPKDPVRYRTKKSAQDAHEAIRPTSVARHPDRIKVFLERDLFRLYSLIWNRFVACQMVPALFDQTELLIGAGDVEFKAVGSILKFDGFLRLYRSDEEDQPEDPSAEGNLLPELTEGEKLKVLDLLREQKFTQPPPRYNEASLVKALEDKGIGRPSTYQQILSVIMSRDYVRRDEGRFSATELGEVVIDLLVNSFNELFDYDYTAKLERDLDSIEAGDADWIETLQGFYQGFKEKLDLARSEMKNLRREEIPTDEKCELCGSAMVMRWGKFGRFLSCANYPKCRNTRELKENDQEPVETPQESCSKCGSPMVLKKGKYGHFLACTGYPKCKNTKKLIQMNGQTVPAQETELDENCPSCGDKLVKKLGRYGEFVACRQYPECRYIKANTTGVTCPECKEGEVVERKSRRGKIFYGCDRYPDCKFVLWQKPISESCPECEAPYLLEKTTKKSGTRRFCPNKECGFVVEVDGSPEETSAGVEREVPVL
jgi:DNA topoisomerase-1